MHSKLENHFTSKKTKKFIKSVKPCYDINKVTFELINKSIESEEDQAFLDSLIKGLNIDEGMDEIFDEWLLKAENMAGNDALRKLGIKLDFSLKNEELLAELQNRGYEITGNIDAKTLQDFQNILYESYQEEGISPYDVAERIRGLFEETYNNRAMTIARTETGIASNTTEFEAYKRNGVTKKKWLAILDDRTRQSHKDINGTVKDIDEPFVLVTHTKKHGDIESELMFPLDPDGEPQEIINCRCAFTAVFDDNDIPDDNEAWTGGK